MGLYTTSPETQLKHQQALSSQVTPSRSPPRSTMAPPSSKLAVALLLAAAAVLAAVSPATAQTTHDNCAKNKKITVQNLCAHDVEVTLEPLANSPNLFDNGALKKKLPPHNHAEFPVCWWTGRFHADGAPTAEFHVGIDGGSFYLTSNTRTGSAVPVIISPHGAPLMGECPAVGCPVAGRCSVSQVPSGRCRNVQEIKVIYCSPHV